MTHQPQSCEVNVLTMPWIQQHFQPKCHLRILLCHVYIGFYLVPEHVEREPSNDFIYLFPNCELCDKLLYGSLYLPFQVADQDVSGYLH